MHMNSPMNHPMALERRHDLDALRAFAMLLGIALHAALSFIPAPWPVQDGRQNELFGLFVGAIHGFRMPVFFVMSGFFTAMLWRRRGLKDLLSHRFKRIALPLILGVLTVVPAVEWVSARAIELGPGAKPTPTAASTGASVKDVNALEVNAMDVNALEVNAMDVNAVDPATGLTPLSLAVAEDAIDLIRDLLAAGADVDGQNRDGSTALLLAAVYDRDEAAGLLIEAGADLEVKNGDGSSALHTAAFFGRVEVTRLLLEAGANLNLINNYGQTPPQVLAADWQTTAFIAQMVGLELDREQVEAGRAKIAELMGLRGETSPESSQGLESSKGGLTGSLAQLMYLPFFHHLWFLWFLCWLVAAFAVYATLADRLSSPDGGGKDGGWKDGGGKDGGWKDGAWKDSGRRFVLSPLRLLWLVPITFLPQFFMGRLGPVFGADTSAGFLPMPHVLAFYGIFFFFGALYHDADDETGRIGRWWFLSLPFGLFILFPVGAGLAFSGLHNSEPGVRALAVLLQALYPWVMTFGLMGLFRRLLSRERPALRYLSDASYWLYLTHLPLIMGAQILVRNWPMSALAKFTLVCLSVTGLLLLIYQVAVRYTWVGRLLNGPRKKPQPSHAGSPATALKFQGR